MIAANPLHGTERNHENWVPLLELAASEVFELMLGRQLILAERGLGATFDVTAMVGLAGQLCGVLSVRCTAACAALIASRMLGLEPGEPDEQTWDALGEVCNMVAGNFKNKIDGLGDGCMLSVPTVITGSQYKLHCLADSAALEVALMFENMPLVIALEIHQLSPHVG